MSWQLKEEVLENVLIDDLLDEGHALVVFNDEHNTFEHVINTLIKVCRHEPAQAEQCTYIIHFNGKCEVKRGSYDDLKPMRESIVDAGIKASII